MPLPRCPFCFQVHDFEKTRTCPNTINTNTNKAEEVSLAYVREYNTVPPLPLVTIGFSKVGKTTYLAALTMMLEHLDRTWYETSYQINDPESDATIKEIRRQAITGDLPPKTTTGILRPLFINVLDLPGQGSNCLVLYDTPGEIFETLNGTESGNYIQSLKMIYNIWFMISLTDLEDQQYQMKINDLLFSYINAMKRMGWSLKGRNLIVVYTKGDKIIPYANSRFPIVVKEHFEDDPFQNLTMRSVNVPDLGNFSLEEYVQKMQAVSDALAKYTAEEVDGGRAFINLAKKNGLGLYFTMVSATGAAPINGRLLIESARYCVLDPYLWALYLTTKKELPQIRLILDASSKAANIYSSELQTMVDLLNDIGDVTVYYLGQTNAASVVGQKAPSSPPRNARCRLIGPILERIPSQDLVIVMTCGEVIDLQEFSSSEWCERLLLVAVGEDQYQNYSNTLVLRQSDSTRLVVEEFRRTFSKYLDE
jgi:hypothetical protein